MNNFQEFESRNFDLSLLNEMYAIPSKELSTKRITEILSVVTGQKLDNVMVSTIFKNAGLNLRERNRVAPKEVEVKIRRVTKAETAGNLLSQLGIAPVVNGEENVEGNDVSVEEMTEQEQQSVDEVVETNQFSRTESIYSSNGVA